jgi:ribosome-associated protein
MTSINLAISPSAIEEHFIRSSGPGGQNVNKVATAVQLRVDLARSGLSDDVRERLIVLAGNRITADGILIIDSRAFRTQAQNREAARERLAELVGRAMRPHRKRRSTKRTRAANERRLSSKHRRGSLKKQRATEPDD